ncbi:protein Mpv17 [Platysternon megacephalum]|uniref:Protein Mpv17 n=1 Tax=Platysternon megacephalum TaxID=55544 RepID=A0A4D9DY00_9SAUR|nr:protein Mpv17 [Platysternon megacephalum]
MGHTLPTRWATPHCLKQSRAQPPQHGDAVPSDRLQLSGEPPGHRVGDLLYPLLPGAEPSAATSPARSRPLCTPQRLEGCACDRRTSHRQQWGKLPLPAVGSRWAQLTDLYFLAFIHPSAAH